MQRKMRIELTVGIGILAVALILRQFTPAPEFALGLLFGLSICLEIIGVLPDKAYNSLKHFKQRVIQRI